MLKYDVEVSGFGSQALGHVCLLNLNDQTYPGSEGNRDEGLADVDDAGAPLGQGAGGGHRLRPLGSRARSRPAAAASGCWRRSRRGRQVTRGGESTGGTASDETSPRSTATGTVSCPAAELEAATDGPPTGCRTSRSRR